MNARTQTSHRDSPRASAPSPELLAGIERVRKELPLATDFAELYECFDDHVVHTDDLWTSSEDGDNERLVMLVTVCATQLRPGFVPLTTSCHRVRGTDFWHGMVSGANAMACFFFDDEVGRGLMALTNPFDGTSLTHFIRFTRVMVDAMKDRVAN